MKWLVKLFTEHPNSVGESYWQHFMSASRISARLGIACSSQLVHAIFPFIYPPLESDIESLMKFLDESQPEKRGNRRLN